MAIKIYRDLEEAIKDVRFAFDVEHSHLGHYSISEIDHATDKGKTVDSISVWLEKIATEYLGQALNDDFKQSMKVIIHHLIVNAYRYGIEFAPTGGKITVENWVGRKGVLAGTKQQYNFFSPDQITYLQRGLSLLSTCDKSGDGGTELFVKEGNGILVCPDTKEIFVSKYYNNRKRKN